MISRRLIRIKVFKVLFSRISSGSDSLIAAERELLHSCEKTQELYHYLLWLPVALKKVGEARIEAGLKKFHPKPEEKNPNRRFVENRVISALESDSVLSKYCSSRSLNWSGNESLVKQLYNSLISKEYFQEYMSAPQSGYTEDLKLLVTFYQEELEDNEDLWSVLEDESLWWTDDLAYTINVIIRNLYLLKEGGVISHPDVFIKDDDREYALRLLSKSLLNYDEYVETMSSYIINWEPERLAATDTSLIVMGIAEAVSFPNIPLKVTINEYVELAKFYSTPNSRLFVNGILDKLLLDMQRDGRIEKTGRGLVGSIE
ncbi:MAG: transcription antitermination protein NusB [Bacteroidales bacterium]|nr:transcription antitermination protein NusB [Bacteroidales bacterium]MDD3989771.1 transcription antitermination protein NusB [Bacteroidales bacterium]